MIRYGDKTLNGLEFVGVVDFKRYLDVNMNTHYTKSLTRTDEWSGVNTWYDFQHYLDEGNTEITADIKKYTKMYVDKFEKQLSERTEYVFDVTGQFFDIGAVMVGEPEAWIKEIVVQEDKFIELNIQGAYQHNTDLNMVRKNGAKLFAIASVLEQKGLLVRINMFFRSKGSENDKPNSITEMKIMVKDYNQGLDYKKLGILLGVPFFRRGYLRLLEIEYDTKCKDSYGKVSYKDGEINLSVTSEVDNLEKMLKDKK